MAAAVTQLGSGTSLVAPATATFTAASAGDVLVLVVTAGALVNNTVAGWTLGNNPNTSWGHAWWWKVATGSETSASYTLNVSSTSAYWVGKITGLDAADPFDASGAAQTGAAASHSTPSVASSAGDKFALASMAVGTTSSASMSAWTNSFTEIFDGTADAGGGIWLGLGVASHSLAGGGGVQTGASFTPSASVCSGFVSVWNVASTPALTAPTFVAAGALTAVGTAVTTIGPVAIPAGAVANDIMVLGLMANASRTFTTPTGWTALGTSVVSNANQSTAWFWKRHTGSETNPSSTVNTALSSTIGGYGRIYLFRGATTSGNPFEGVGNAGTPTTSTTPASSAVTTTGESRLVASIAMVDAARTWTSGMPPATWSNIGTLASSTTGGDATYDAIAKTQAAAGTVAAATIGTMTAAYWRTLSFALIPAAGAPVETRTASGTLTLGGTATGLPSITRTATGGLTVGGTATGGPLIARTALGTVTVSGSAAALARLTRTASGGLTLTGTAATSNSVARTASGVLSLSGSATAVARLTRTAQGSLTLSGDAQRTIRYIRTAAGSLSLTGDSVASVRLTRTASGDLTLDGVSASFVRMARTASGSLTLDGDAEAVTRLVRTALAQLDLSGVAEAMVIEMVAGYVNGEIRPVTVTLMIDGVEHPVELSAIADGSMHP